MRYLACFLIVPGLVAFSACTSNNSKSPTSFGQSIFEVLSSGDSAAALQYRIGKNDVETLLERIPDLSKGRGLSVPDDDDYLRAFEWQRGLFKNKGGPIGRAVGDSVVTDTIRTIEYDSLQLRNEKILGKGIAYYDDSYLFIRINGNQPSHLIIERIIRIDDQLRIFSFSH